MRGRRSTVWWGVVLSALLVGVSFVEAKKSGEDAHGPASRAKRDDEFVPRKERDAIVHETEDDLKKDGVEVDLPKAKELKPGDKVEMEVDGERVVRKVPADADVETTEVGTVTSSTASRPRHRRVTRF